MSNSFKQALLMDDPEGDAPTPVPACETDIYYDCGPTNDPHWDSVVVSLHFNNNVVDEKGHVFSAQGTSFTTASKFGSHALNVGGVGGTSSGTNVVYSDTTSSDYWLDSDFTIECWALNFEVDSGTPRTLVGIFEDDGSAAGKEYFRLSISETSTDRFSALYPTGLTTTANMTSTVDPEVGRWYHVALTRISSTLTFFVDGVPYNRVTSSYFRPVNVAKIFIGNRSRTQNAALFGYIDDVRITKGVCRYVDGFSVPTRQFPDALETVWSNPTARTVLLYHAEVSNQIIATDAGFDPTATAGGRITYSNQNRRAQYPNLAGTEPITDIYHTRSRRGGKWYWELYVSTYGNGGRSQWLPDDNSSSEWYHLLQPIPTASWTNPGGGGYSSFSLSATGDGKHYSYALDIDKGHLWIRVDGGAWEGGGDPELGTTPTLFGQARPGRPSVELSPNFGSGADVEAAFKAEHMTYAIPAGFTAWGADTTAAKDSDATLEDDSCAFTKVVTLGNFSSYSEDVKKFGNSSVFISDFTLVTQTPGIRILRHDDFLFGAAEFTIEFWAYRKDNNRQSNLWAYSTSTNSYVRVGTDGLIDAFYGAGSGYTRTNVASFPTAQWVHVVVQRKAGAFQIFLNGVLVDAVATSNETFTHPSTVTNKTGIVFGGGIPDASGTTDTFNGYIDEIRITKGVARYSDPFDVATLPWCPDEEVVFPTSGTEYPRSATATVQQGAVGLTHHYQVLSGQQIMARTGGISNGVVPNGIDTTFSGIISSTNPGPFFTDITGVYEFYWGGQVLIKNNATASATTYGSTVWLSGENDYTYQIKFSIVESEFDTARVALAAQGDGAFDTWITQSPLVNNRPSVFFSSVGIAVGEQETSVIRRFVLRVQVRPDPTSGLVGEWFERDYTITFNGGLTKPIPEPYPALTRATHFFDFSQLSSSQIPDFIEFKFLPDGRYTIQQGRSGTPQLQGTWIDTTLGFDVPTLGANLVPSYNPPSGEYRAIGAPYRTNVISSRMNGVSIQTFLNLGQYKTSGEHAQIGAGFYIYPTPDYPFYSRFRATPNLQGVVMFLFKLR